LEDNHIEFLVFTQDPRLDKSPYRDTID